MSRKRILIILSAALILILAALVSVPYFVDTNQFRSRVISGLESALHRKVSVQSAELTVLTGLGLRLNRLVVFEDPQFGPVPFARLTSLRVRLRLLPLLLGKVEVGLIQVVDPEISLVKDKVGTWNFESLGKGAKAESPASKALKGKGSAGTALLISGLSFRNGTLTIRNEMGVPRAQESRYERIDLDLADLALSHPGSFSLEVQLPGPARQRVSARGKVGPFSPSDLAKTPIDGKIEFSDASISELLTLLSPAGVGDVEWQGSVSTETNLRGNLADLLHLEGRTQFKNLQSKRQGQESPEVSGNLEYQIDYRLPSGSLSIARCHLSLPSSMVDLKGGLTYQGQQGKLNLRFDSDKCSIEDLLKTASVLGQGPPKGVEATGMAQLHLTVGGSATAPAIAGQASFNSFQVKYPGLKDRISISPWTVNFDENGISSNEVQIVIGDQTRLKAHTAAILSPFRQITMTLDSQSPILLSDLIALGSTFGINLPAGYGIEAGSIALHVNAQKRLEERSELTLKGLASVQGARLRSPLFNVPMDVKQAQLNFTGGSVGLSDLLASLGDSTLRGNLQLIDFGTPSLTFNLNVDQLDLVALDKMVETGSRSPVGRSANLVPADPSPIIGPWLLAPSSVEAAGKPSRPSPIDPLAKLVIHDSHVGIQSVKYETLLLKQVTSKVQMKNKILGLTDLQFRMNQGIHTGSATLDFNGPLPRYAFNSRLKDVDTNEFLTQNTSLKNMIYGMLSLDMDVRGDGSSFGEITRNLKGQGKLNLLKGRFTSFNLSEQLAALGKLAGFNQDPSGTEINELAGDFQISDGRASTNNLRLRTPSGNLKATGSFGFDKTVDFQILAELPGAASKKYAGVNPLLDLAAATFFKNEQGNIVLPLRMTGTVTAPRFTLDSKVVQENLKKRGLNQTIDSIKEMFKSKSGNTPSGQQTTPSKPSQQKPTTLDDLLNRVNEEVEKKKK